MKEVSIQVKGMICNGCENRIQNALKTIPGVENVIANYKNGTVIVTLKNELEENILKEKIEDLDFIVEDI